MKRFTTLLVVLFFISAVSAQDSKMNAYIDALMKKMTLEEKIGQLNLPSIGFDVTGPILSTDVEGKIRKGLVGGVLIHLRQLR
jgi:beta-glucosidase